MSKVLLTKGITIYIFQTQLITYNHRNLINFNKLKKNSSNLDFFSHYLQVN